MRSIWIVFIQVGAAGQDRLKLEQELQQIQSLMNGLSTQGGQISQTMENLKSSTGTRLSCMEYILSGYFFD